MSISSFDTSPSNQHPKVSVVDRPRLRQLLSTKARCPLILITAPAGYGKTTAIQQWTTLATSPVVWVKLGAEETSASDLASAIVNAMAGDASGRIVNGRSPRSNGNAARETHALAVELTDALRPDTTLVIDNVPSNALPDQLDLLGALAEAMSKNCRMVVASRAHLELPVSRLRADGAVAEVRHDALAFTVDETRTLLSNGLGFGLTRDQATTLQRRTEGWAAGLRLAALTLQESSDIAISVEVFNGANRYVHSYFVDEVLSGLPDSLRDLLLTTSITTSMNAELASTLTKHDETVAFLERLSKDNLFVIPVDETNRWYRYHHLFSDFLRFRLERERPNEMASLHRLACSWFTEHDRPQDATYHAVALRDWELAVSLLKPLGGPAAVKFQTIVDWIRTLPEEALRNQPALSIWNAWSELQAGHIRAAERAIDLSEQTWKAQGDNSHRAEILFLRSRVARCRAEGRLAVSLGEQVISAIGDTPSPLRVLTMLVISRGHMIVGSPIEAEAAAMDAVKLAQEDPNGPEFTIGVSLAYVGKAQVKQCRLAHALETFNEANDICASSPEGVPVHVTISMSDVLIERNELDHATELLTSAMSRVRLENLGVLKPEIWINLAKIAYAQRNTEGTLLTLEHIISWSRRTGSRICLARAEGLRARVWLDHGEFERVQSWLDRCGLDEDSDVSYEHEEAYFALARLLLRQYVATNKVSYSDRGLRILRQLGTEALNQKRNLDALRAMTLGALGRQDRGDMTKAFSHLERGLNTAVAERAFRAFLDEGDAMLRLAQTARDGGMVNPHLDSLIAAFDHDNGAERLQGVSQSDPQVVELSKREHEILRYIAAGLTNQEIADRMFISVNTVKTHLKHIFTKVGATSRAQAIARSFSIGLL